MSWKRGVVIAVALVVSAALVLLAFFRPVFAAEGFHLVPRFDVATWASRLPSHLPWVVPFVLLTASLSALRAIVWKHTLPAPPPRWGARFHALALGGLIHNVLPGRMGVLGSAWVLSYHKGGPLPSLLSSLLLAKLLEFGALFAATAGLALVARARGMEGAPGGALVVAGLGALAVFSAALLSARRFGPRLSARLHARGRWLRVAAALDAVVAGLAAVGTPRHLLAGGAVALLPVLASTLAYALALRHMGVDAYLLGGGLVVAAVTLGQFTPGLPVGVGVYYFVCTAAARKMGVQADDAAALAVLSHAATAVTHLLVGVIAAAADHGVLRDVVKFRRALASAGVQPTVTPSGSG